MRTSARAVVAVALAAPLALGIGGVASTAAAAPLGASTTLLVADHPNHEHNGSDGSHAHPAVNHQPGHEHSGSQGADGNSGVNGPVGQPGDLSLL
jgi:hypothetical protein